MNKLDLIKQLRNRTLERVLSEHSNPTGDLVDMKLSIWDLRVILYDESRKLAESIIKEDFS